MSVETIHKELTKKRDEFLAKKKKQLGKRFTPEVREACEEAWDAGVMWTARHFQKALLGPLTKEKS